MAQVTKAPTIRSKQVLRMFDPELIDREARFQKTAQSVLCSHTFYFEGTELMLARTLTEKVV